MTDRADHGFAYLPPAAAGLGHIFARPKWIAAACIVALTALGWVALGIMTLGESGLADALSQLCRAPAGTQASVPLVGAMWTAMVLAMMLPSAAPMILTYAEIADTAARKGEHVVSPLVLAAGYTFIWLGFSSIATLAQVLLAWVAVLDTDVAAGVLFSGAIFIAAGVYQFSALKHACLRQCQNPFPFFFANWATSPRGVFRLGVKQGMFCVGCCWAMMLVMLAVGVMNVIWMVGLGIVMAVEKLGAGRWFTRAMGAVLIAAGAAFILSGFAAHWPGHPI